jgi:hypothetical protein
MLKFAPGLSLLYAPQTSLEGRERITLDPEIGWWGKLTVREHGRKFGCGKFATVVKTPQIRVVCIHSPGERLPSLCVLPALICHMNGQACM